MDYAANGEEPEVGGFLELLLEIAGLQRLKIHWIEKGVEDPVTATKLAILSELLERKLELRREKLHELRALFPEMQAYSWAICDEWDA